MAKRKAKRARRAFEPAFKAEAVRLCKVGDRTIRQVASDLDLTETALREWVKRADAEAESPSTDVLSTDERDELKELRKRVKRRPWAPSSGGSPAKAVTATARKIATVLYNTLRHGRAYVDPGESYYEQRYQERTLHNLRRRAGALGFSLVADVVDGAS